MMSSMPATEMSPREATAAAGEPLRRLLARVRREARAWVWLDSLAAVAVAAAVIFWATLGLDWLLEPPAWARACTVAAAVAALLWLVGTRLVGRLAAPLTDRALALAVERRVPECGDTLSTAITLADAGDEPVDADLAGRTTTAAAALAGGISTRAVFRRGRLLATALVGAAAAASVAGLVAARPAVATIWARRLALLDDTPWPRRVSLEAEGFVAGVRKVARGSDVDILARATASGPLPDVVELRTRAAGEPWRTVRMGTRGGGADGTQTFGHLLEAVGGDIELEIRGGDARLRGLVLDVVEPPALAEVTIRCTLPDYLGGGRRDPPASRVVAVPRGARLDVTFRSTKPLAAARIVGRFADQAAEVVLASLEATTPPADTITAEIPLLDADGTLTATFTDTDGITAREPITLAVTAVPDEPPRLGVRLADISTAVTPRARLPIVGTLADDHGLVDATVSLGRGEAGGRPTSVPLPRVRGGELLVELTPDRPEVVPLEPLGLAAGDRLTAVVTARDACPLAGGPNVGSGETWTLEVVSPEALVAMLEAREVLLRRRFEAAIEDLAAARRGLDQATGDDGGPRAAGRLGEATARAGGETGEIATAFRGIHGEFANNALLTPELQTRLVDQIAEPLAAVATGPLAALAEDCRGAARGDVPLADLVTRADEALAALRAVLARMLELESFNEVVERLRGMIEAQERIRRDTLERQRQRARELLE
jgi:hypothetical protein